MRETEAEGDRGERGGERKFKTLKLADLWPRAGTEAIGILNYTKANKSFGMVEIPIPAMPISQYFFWVEG